VAGVTHTSGSMASSHRHIYHRMVHHRVVPHQVVPHAWRMAVVSTVVSHDTFSLMYTVQSIRASMSWNEVSSTDLTN